MTVALDRAFITESFVILAVRLVAILNRYFFAKSDDTEWRIRIREKVRHGKGRKKRRWKEEIQ
jgi:hypothetical protein